MQARREVNDISWSDATLVAEYANRDLRPVEVVILFRHREALSGRVLELGPGGGRITGYLLEIADEVTGVDLMTEMVDYCRVIYPAGNFELGDLGDLSRFADASVDAIVAGFNVIDVLGDAERRECLAAICRILSPGGLLVMSSHNLGAAASIRTPWQVRGGGIVATAQNILRLPRRVLNRRRLIGMQAHHADYAILNDLANDYSVLHYYIGSGAQEAQLREAGFELVECLDLDGHPVEPGDAAAHSYELHYLARNASVGNA